MTANLKIRYEGTLNKTAKIVPTVCFVMEHEKRDFMSQSVSAVFMIRRCFADIVTKGEVPLRVTVICQKQSPVFSQ